MKQLSKIGFIVKSHKLSGALKLILKDYNFVSTLTPNLLYIETKNTTLPYFVEKLDAINDNEIIVKFEELNSKEDANVLKGALVFIDSSGQSQQCFEKVKRVEDQLNLTGYQLFNEENEFIAQIEDVYFVPNNTLAAIIIENEEVLIPLNEKLIINLDRIKKTVYLEIPGGLLNLNTSTTEEE